MGWNLKSHRHPTLVISLFLLATLAAHFTPSLTVTTALASYSCERHLLPELTFSLSGSSLDWACGDSTRTFLESQGSYQPRNVIPTRLQIHGDHVVLAMPRFRPGVPFTLGSIRLKPKKPGSGSNWSAPSPIAPYPDDSQFIRNVDEEEKEDGSLCHGDELVNAVDLVLDPKDILWVLDTGVLNSLEHPKTKCPPKVVAIDVKSGEVTKVIDLSEFVLPNSRLQYLLVEHPHKTGVPKIRAQQKVFIYITDAATRSILVYDVLSESGHRVSLPESVTEGCDRQDVLYAVLVKNKGPLRSAPLAYFTYLGSPRLFAVDTDSLRRGYVDGSVIDVGPKMSKIVLLGTDNGCAIFFRNDGQSDIYMWNTNTAFRAENFLMVQKGSECRLPTQVVPGYKRLMWVIESNFQDYIQNTVSCSGASVSLHPLVKSGEL